MQRVVHEYRNSSRIFTMLDNLYAFVSDTTEDEDIIWLDTVFTDVCKLFQENIFTFQMPKIKDFNLPKVEYNTGNPKEIIVCLSGGKDSAACAYYYKQRGYTVHLYHSTGVNKAYGDEKKAAERIAKYLDCDLFIDKLFLKGTHQYVEHPMKNYVIANGAIHYALGCGYRPVIAFGNFNKASLETNAFNVCAGDCVEMWDAYRKIIQSVIPDFDIEIPLETNATTFNLLSEDWELFSLAVSCMSPFRFREYWKHREEQKYGVRMFDNRCGCCWKCCMEAMWLMDTDKMEYNEPFYYHCYEILERTIYKETGIFADNVQAVWDNYMFYPFEQSKAHNLLKDKKIKESFH